MTSRDDSKREMPTQNLVLAAATLSTFAAVFHIWVMRVHFEHWWVYGLMFLVMTMAQGLYTVALLTWHRVPLILLGGIFGNLSIIVAYTFTRTVGIPFSGPHGELVESVGYIDLASKATEGILVIMLMVIFVMVIGWRVPWNPVQRARVPLSAELS